MTPDPSFVADLRAYDPRLRVRWALHSARWFIERELPPRNPQWISERPNPFGRSARAKDLWEGWRDGYVHVLSVDQADLHWSIVAPVLTEQDSQQAGGFDALNRKMDEAEAAWERHADGATRDWAEQASYDAYDHLAWREGRRVSLHQPAAVDIPHPDGFVIRDRRVKV